MLTIFLSRDGRLRAGWRFLLGVTALAAADLGSRYLVGFVIGPGSPILFIFLQEPIALALQVLLFALLLTVADRVSGDRLAAQGLPRYGPWLHQFCDGFLLGGGMVTVCVVAVRLFGGLSFVVAFSAKSLFACFLIFALLLVGAIKEEVAFRGYPFQRLIEGGGPRWGPVLGVVVLSVLFGLVHWHNPSRTLFSTANTVLIGIVLAVAYLRTWALWFPIGIHFGWNFMLGVVFGLPVSGIADFGVLVRGTATGPAWLTGGAYGIEASAVATGVVAISMVPAWLMYRPAAAGLEQVLGWPRKPAGRADADDSGGIKI
ncbi:MAG: CPBP family intramembrane metalloprotease [Candidatus Koribacter versatilis]|uniref:CPBP family intramembrane metalloprotease n=1 Tax=Candidatus Korobacter versatilis TaxID=658062 RepID=A0A932ENM8_9BACT|nr:CPBP family intramembrane metalloprotease [Candidatus Koribacter versatilis]